MIAEYNTKIAHFRKGTQKNVSFSITRMGLSPNQFLCALCYAIPFPLGENPMLVASPTQGNPVPLSEAPSSIFEDTGKTHTIHTTLDCSPIARILRNH
jgi:hypothetical protein